jgi:TolB-like protein/tetratricopeptide (TPR) repeat protein
MDAVASPDISLFEDFRLDRRGGVLFRRDQQGVFVPLVIGSRALDILGVLVEQPGDLVSRDEIIEVVWRGRAVEDSNLNVQVAALRRILDRNREQGSCIQTVAGRGYRFVIPVARWEDGAHTPSHAIAVPGGRPAPRLSIVVLPFTNLSDDRKQEYFADAMTDSLTTDLSRLAGSFVISCNTAFTYKGRRVSAKQIGAELGVRYVLEGSVQRSGKQARVNVQLIDAETDAHVWAERFERDTDDLFALQEEITRRIAVTLNIELVGAEAARPTKHPKALDYILRGRAATMTPASRENRTEAIGLFEQALALDPRSVAAQSYLATALSARILDHLTDTAAADIERATGLAGQALAASPRSPLAHYANGQVLRAQNRYAEAIGEYETAIAFDRNWVRAYALIAWCKLYTGPIEEAILLVEQAIRLSPRDPVIGIWYMLIGQAHLLQSRSDEAVIWLEKARSAIPAQPGVRALLACAYALKGQTEPAAVELAEARRLSLDGGYSSVARLKATGYYGMPKIRALYEATYFKGLRLAGMSEE